MTRSIQLTTYLFANWPERGRVERGLQCHRRSNYQVPTPIFGNGNYTAFAEGWIRRCSSTRTASAVGPACSASDAPRRCAASARSWSSAALMPWKSASRTASGAGSPRPNASCCSSARSVGRAASAGPPRWHRRSSQAFCRHVIAFLVGPYLLTDLRGVQAGVRPGVPFAATVAGMRGKERAHVVFARRAQSAAQLAVDALDGRPRVAHEIREPNVDDPIWRNDAPVAQIHFARESDCDLFDRLRRAVGDAGFVAAHLAEMMGQGRYR